MILNADFFVNVFTCKVDVELVFDLTASLILLKPLLIFTLFLAAKDKVLLQCVFHKVSRVIPNKILRFFLLRWLVVLPRRLRVDIFLMLSDLAKGLLLLQIANLVRKLHLNASSSRIRPLLLFWS